MTTRRFITLIVLVMAGLATQRLIAPSKATVVEQIVSPTPEDHKGYDLVTKVIDGDTIELADGRKVRYLGIDTPETVHPSKPVQCFGKEASDYNKNLVSGQYVRLVRDVEDKDKYGRLLRYVYMEDGTFVNLALVAWGYAYAYTYPPNVARAKEFVAAQAQARESGTGLWSACPPKK